MPKAGSASQLASRILNSKGASASSATASRRPYPSRNSNSKSTQQRHQSSPILTARGQRSEPRALKAAASESGGFNSDGLDEGNLLEPAKMRKTTRTSTKITTAKEKRQATLAAAERNAARLTTDSEIEDQVPSEDDHSQDEGDNTHPFKALTFGDDSADNDEDDEEDPPEAAHRPRLTRGRSVEYDEDDEHDGGAVGLENNDSDEDDPANSPTRQTARKGKSAGVTFTAPATTSLSSKLPVKKVRSKTKANKHGSNIPFEGTRSPARVGTPASSPSAGGSSASPPKTPRSKASASASANRHRLYDQTPSTQGLLKASSSDTRQDLLVEDAFPERTIFTEKCKATFLAACADIQATLHRQRFLKSNTYRGMVLYILRQKLSQVRQEVRNAALAKTSIHYGITSSMEPGDIVSRIDRLKTKIAYVFGDIDQYKQPYGNPLIQILINVLFFEGKRKSDALANPVPWNPMPLPIIALVATAIHSVLDDWSSGKNEAAKSKFSHDKYAPVYRDHLANLDKFKQRAPAALSKLQISLWENAWLSTGSALPDQANVYIDDDVFAEAEAEALA